MHSFIHVLVDQYPEDHQHGTAPVQLCLHLCKTDRLMEECFFVFFGWWGWFWKGSLKVAAFQRNLPHSRNSLLGNLLWWNMFHLEMLFVQQEFFCQTRRLGAPALHPFPQLLELFSLPSYHPPSFQPSVPLKCAIDRSLSGAPSLLGLAVRLCFISPTKH